MTSQLSRAAISSTIVQVEEGCARRKLAGQF